MNTTASKAAVAVGLLLLLLLAGGTAFLVTQEGDAPDGDTVADTEPGTDDRRAGADVAGSEDGSAAADREAASDGVPEPATSEHVVRISILGANGAPLPGAVVEFHPIQDVFPLSGAWEQGAALLRDVEPVAVGTTDAEGALHVELPGQGPWTMVTRAAGHTTGYRWGISGRALDADNADEPIVEQLQPGHAVRGRVLDRGGGGVANLPLLASPAQSSDREVRGSRATTARDGSFVLDGLPPGEVLIHTGAVQLGRIRSPLRSTLVLRLEGHTITGTVTLVDDGSPIERVDVIAQPNTGSGGLVRTTTDAAGRYTLNTLVSGPVFSMRLDKAGFTDTREKDYIAGGVGIDADGQGVMDFTMTVGATLTGTVTVDSVPVADVGVAVVGTNWRPYVTRTGSDGSFSVDGLPAGRAAVIVECLGTERHQAGLPRQWLSRLARGDSIGEWEVALTLGETTIFDARLSSGVAVSGTVLLPDGTPAEGAKVWVNGRQSEPTDAGGAFRCDGVRPQERSTAGARLGDLAASAALSVPQGADLDGVELQLQPQVDTKTTLTGHVLDAVGEPVAAAVVQWIEADRRAPSRDPWASAARAAMSTDAYEITTHLTGRLSLRAIAQGFAPSDVRTVDSDPGNTLLGIDFVLHPAPSIRGIARTSDGVPVVGARVSLHEGGPRYDLQTLREYTTAATTNSDGRFEIADVVPGMWTVIVDAPNVVRWMEGVRVDEDHDLVAVCERALSITGTLRLASGEPLTGISVIAQRQGAQPQEPGYSVSDACAPDGRFDLRGLPAGEYELQTFAFPGAKTSLARMTVTGIAAGTQDLEIEVQSAGQISGVVLDADGAPMANASIQGFSESGDKYTPSCSSDKDGAFVLNSLAPTKGPYSLRVRPPDPQRYQRCEILDRHIGMQLTGVHVGTTGVEARLPLGHVIEGTLIGADGEPLPKAWVKAECVTNADVNFWQRHWYQGPAAQADAEGRFRIRGLPQASFALFLIPDPMLDPAGRPTPLAGAERVVAGATDGRYAAVATGSITGIVVDEQGAAVVGVRVRAQPEGDESRSAVVSVKSADDGRFVLEGVVADRVYEITATAKDLVPWKRAGVRAGGAALTVELTAGESISGKLVVPDGQQAKGRYLKIHHETEDVEIGFATGDDGAFERRALPPGTYRVEVQTNPGTWPAEMQTIGTITAGEQDITLRLE